MTNSKVLSVFHYDYKFLYVKKWAVDIVDIAGFFATIHEQ